MTTRIMLLYVIHAPPYLPVKTHKQPISPSPLVIGAKTWITFPEMFTLIVQWKPHYREMHAIHYYIYRC